MPSFLFGAGFVEQLARQDFGGNGIVARGARWRFRLWRQRRFGDGLGLRRCGSRRALELLGEILDHAGGFLAARHAEIQPLFLAGNDRTGIILAVVAALAAILLRHRRHHLPAQRLVVRELHAFGQRQGLIVPRRAAVIVLRALGVRRARHQRDSLVSRQRRHARIVERNQPGEEAVEPGALVLGERRGFGHQRWNRRRHVFHHAASASNIVFSASTSCRRANVRKVSSRAARCAM